MNKLKSTGNPDADRSHQRMVDLMESIIKHTENGHTTEELKFQLLELYSIAEVHFKEEEELMQEIEFPFMPIHIMAHEDTLSKIRVFLEIIEHSKKDYNILVNTLLHVIETHVANYDVPLFLFNSELKQAGILGQWASSSLPS